MNKIFLWIKRTWQKIGWENCSNCKFFFVVDGKESCRRFPPDWGFFYKAAKLSSWCGEYQKA